MKGLCEYMGKNVRFLLNTLEVKQFKYNLMLVLENLTQSVAKAIHKMKNYYDDVVSQMTFHVKWSIIIFIYILEVVDNYNFFKDVQVL